MSPVLRPALPADATDILIPHRLASTLADRIIEAGYYETDEVAAAEALCVNFDRHKSSTGTPDVLVPTDPLVELSNLCVHAGISGCQSDTCRYGNPDAELDEDEDDDPCDNCELEALGACVDWFLDQEYLPEGYVPNSYYTPSKVNPMIAMFG